jgi:ABC-type oligopeptide transport system substrate-binding subunit
LHGNAEAYVGGWGALSAPVSVLARKFTARGGQNRTGFSDPEVERLLAEAEAEQRLGTRVELVRAAQRRLSELVPWIPVAYAQNLFASSKRVATLPFRVVESWYEFPRLLAEVEVRDAP